MNRVNAHRSTEARRALQPCQAESVARRGLRPKHIKERLFKKHVSATKIRNSKLLIRSVKVVVLWDKFSQKNGMLYLTTCNQMHTAALPVISKANFLAFCEYTYEELLHLDFDKFYNYLCQNYVVLGIAPFAKHFSLMSAMPKNQAIHLLHNARNVHHCKPPSKVPAYHVTILAHSYQVQVTPTF